MLPPFAAEPRAEDILHRLPDPLAYLVTDITGGAPIDGTGTAQRPRPGIGTSTLLDQATRLAEIGATSLAAHVLSFHPP